MPLRAVVGEGGAVLPMQCKTEQCGKSYMVLDWLVLIVARQIECLILKSSKKYLICLNVVFCNMVSLKALRVLFEY